MTKNKTFKTRFATILAGFLSIALVICANTASTGLIHQPKKPNGLDKFSKLQ